MSRAGNVLRPRTWALLIILCVVLAVWYFTRQGNASTWQTVEVQQGNIEANVAAVGTLQPLHSVDVGAQISGQITRLHVKAGDVVQKGVLLAEIDASVMQATVDAGKAQLAGLHAQLEDAHAQLQLQQQRFVRQQQMEKEGSTRLEDVQTADATYRSAKAKVAQIEAQIAQTNSTLKADEARLGYTRIYAPIGGTVLSVDVKEGQTLNSTYQTPMVMRIADLSRMEVWTLVSEADIRRIKTNTPAQFTTLGGLGEDNAPRWEGKVSQVLPAPPVKASTEGSSASATTEATNKVVQYVVLFDVGNEDGELMPQMTAQVVFVTDSAKDVVIAPLGALEAVDGKAGFYQARVLDAKNNIQVRDVKIGRRDRLSAEVLDGVTSGERLVVGELTADGQIRRFQW
jgi:macrolide-specific efflux system membrane fusion protein